MALIMMPAKKPAKVVQTAVAVAEPEVMQAPTVVLIPKVEPTIPTSAVEVLVAEYLDLWKKYDYFEVKAMVKRMDDIRKELVAYANTTMEDTKPAIFACSTGEVEFSERAKNATVPNPLALIQELLVKFGPDVTTSVVSIGITALRKVLSDFELKKHLVEEPGTRTLKGVRPQK